MSNDYLMIFDPATGERRPYPSHPDQWRKFNRGTAWLFSPLTGERRDARDVGSDTFGQLISGGGQLSAFSGEGCASQGSNKA